MKNMFTLLVCDNLAVGPLAKYAERPGYHLALIREAQPADGETKSEGPHVDPSDVVLQLVDLVNPDLILVGNNLGVGKDKVLYFPRNKKRVTTILSNDPLSDEDRKWYEDRNFTSFCLRKNLTDCLPHLIQAALDVKQRIRTELPKGMPIPDPKVVLTNGA